MILKGVRQVQMWKAQNKERNLEEWYRRNKWSGNAYDDIDEYSERTVADNAVFDALFDVPNR